jgi:hypothetical protein
MKAAHSYCRQASTVLLGVLLSLSSMARAQNRQPGEVLRFQLPDAHGRVVDAQDYAGVPVLIMTGACW